MDKLGLIAGSGSLPLQIVRKCKEKNITPYIILLKDFALQKDYKDYTNTTIKLGQVGKAISFFKKNNINDIIFAGAVKKPNLRTIIPDFTGLFLLGRLLKNKMFGDDTILRDIIKFAEERGFNIIPINKFLDLSIPQGNMGKIKLPMDYENDVKLGIAILNKMSDFDMGQSVVIQNGIVLGFEGVEGTENLIKRCGELKYVKGKKPILVKMKKGNQTDKADLPTIGENTIRQLKDNGYAGVVMDCDGLIVEYEKTIALANELGIFIYGKSINDFQ